MGTNKYNESRDFQMDCSIQERGREGGGRGKGVGEKGHDLGQAVPGKYSILQKNKFFTSRGEKCGEEKGRRKGYETGGEKIG